MLFNRNVKINGRRTSMRLDRLSWGALEDISKREEMSLHDLCTYIYESRGKASMTTATRIFIVAYYRAIIQELEHSREKTQIPLIDVLSGISAISL